MKIYWRPSGQRRELTEEEKDIMAQGLMWGLLAGMILTALALVIGRHLSISWI